MSETIIIKNGPAGLTVLLNRPRQRNALSHELLIALAEALESANCSNSTSITLTGAGSTFSAGADFRELTGTLADLQVDEDIERVTDAIRRLGNVTAYLNGPCMGGAVDIALACRDRTGNPGTVIQVPAGRLSLLYNPVAVEHMVKRYGAQLVRRVLADGERFDAMQALEAGLLSRVEGELITDSREKSEPQPKTEASNAPASMAMREMIQAIADDQFDPGYWENRRREFLESPERLAAVADFKKRMSERQR